MKAEKVWEITSPQEQDEIASYIAHMIKEAQKDDPFLRISNNTFHRMCEEEAERRYKSVEAANSRREHIERLADASWEKNRWFY